MSKNPPAAALTPEQAMDFARGLRTSSGGNCGNCANACEACNADFERAAIIIEAQAERIDAVLRECDKERGSCGPSCCSEPLVGKIRAALQQPKAEPHECPPGLHVCMSEDSDPPLQPLPRERVTDA